MGIKTTPRLTSENAERQHKTGAQNRTDDYSRRAMHITNGAVFGATKPDKRTALKRLQTGPRYDLHDVTGGSMPAPACPPPRPRSAPTSCPRSSRRGA